MTTLVIFNIITAILFVLFLIGTTMILTAWRFKNEKVSDVIFNIGYKLFISTTLLTIVNVYLTKHFCQ